eukprot:SM006960S21025  [mRNA]  locus=s6960:195:767:+ [translate_table: standard]
MRAARLAASLTRGLAPPPPSARGRWQAACGRLDRHAPQRSVASYIRAEARSASRPSAAAPPWPAAATPLRRLSTPAPELLPGTSSQRIVVANQPPPASAPPAESDARGSGGGNAGV